MVSFRSGKPLTWMVCPSGSGLGRDAANPPAAAPAAAAAAAAPAGGVCGGVPLIGELAEESIGEPISEPLSKATGCACTDPIGDCAPLVGEPMSEPLPSAIGWPCTEPIGPAHRTRVHTASAPAACCDLPTQRHRRLDIKQEEPAKPFQTAVL
jgi:hypothetical protein